MSYGGWSGGASCGAACDGGCSVWIEPTNPASKCGEPPSGCPQPADIGNFTPAPMHAPKIEKGSCTTQQIDDYYTTCFTPSSGCDGFRTASASCVQCIESKDTDATWGPIVSSGFVTSYNPSGCMVALTGDSSATSCAQRLDDLSQCEAAACQAQCPLTDQASAILLEQCDSAASAGECAKFVADECGPDAGAVYTQCVAASSNDPEAGFDAIAAAMCGP